MTAWRVAALALVAATLGCSGSSSPASPTAAAVAPANIITASDAVRLDDTCARESATCAWFVDAKNTGAGCADQVTGAVTFSAAAGPVQNGIVTWSLAPERVIRPGETFTYSGTVAGAVLQAAGFFTVAGGTLTSTYRWRDVPC